MSGLIEQDKQNEESSLQKDVDWLHTKILQQHSQIKHDTQRAASPGWHNKETRDFVVLSSVIGGTVGAALAGVTSIFDNFSSPRQSRLAALGFTAAGTALGAVWAYNKPVHGKFGINVDSQITELEHYNNIRNALAQAYGEDSMKGKDKQSWAEYLQDKEAIEEVIRKQNQWTKK